MRLFIHCDATEQQYYQSERQQMEISVAQALDDCMSLPILFAYFA